MAKYPEYSEIAIQPIVQIRPKWKTQIVSFNDEGVERRKQKWLYPKRDIVINYKFITKISAETLWEFYLARKGAFSSFNFFIPEPQLAYPSYTGEYIGAGDGTTSVFSLPSRSGTSRTIYLDGAEQTVVTDYTFNEGGGEDGADQIDFGDSGMVIPGNGAILTYDFTGTLKIRCRFAEDSLPFEIFRDRFVSTGVELKGLLHVA